MEISHLQYILNGVKDGKIEVDEALKELKELSFEDIGYAKIDHNRKIRKGFPEVIYCEGKKNEQVKRFF